MCSLIHSWLFYHHLVRELVTRVFIPVLANDQTAYLWMWKQVFQVRQWVNANKKTPRTEMRLTLCQFGQKLSHLRKVVNEIIQCYDRVLESNWVHNRTWHLQVMLIWTHCHPIFSACLFFHTLRDSMVSASWSNYNKVTWHMSNS